MGYCNNNNCVQEVMLLVGAVSLMISSTTTNAMPAPTPVRKWCVANKKATEVALQNAKKLACGHVDCRPISGSGEKCFEPDTLINHASYALSKYYSRTGVCIQGAGIEVSKNPAPNDECHYPSRIIEPNVPSQSSPTKTENAMPSPTPETKWCVANPKATEAALRNAKKLACGHVDCHPIEAGGKCFEPDTLISHASYAMTKYYNRTGDCEFDGASIEVTDNPSPNDDCRFPSHTNIPNVPNQSAPTKTKNAATTSGQSAPHKAKNTATSAEL